MNRSVHVVLAQLESASADTSANLAEAAEILDHHPHASLVVFPELFLTGYALELPGCLDCTPPTTALCLLADRARTARTAVVVGLAERTRWGPADTALCIDEHGAVVARYRKVHLFGDERQVFAAGEEYLTTVLAGTVVAPLVSYDVEFPESARAGAAAGAELLVTLAAAGPERRADHELFVRCRALENGLPHVYVNRAGTERAGESCGHSMVADACGRVVAELPAGRRAVVAVDVPLGGRPQPDYLVERRAGVHARSITPVAVAGVQL